MKKLKINKNIIGILGANLINDILYMFLNTFMVAYFINLSNHNYKMISLYYIFSYIAITITFTSFSKSFKNKDKSGILRLGIILQCLYILGIALLKEKIITYYLILGLFYGIVQGIFWAALHPLINDYVKKSNTNYISFKAILGNALKIFFPVIFGVSIELTSFSYIAKIIVIISILQILFSFLIKDKNKENALPYNFNAFLDKVKSNDKMKLFYQTYALSGIVRYLLETIITILIIMTFKTSLSLGILTTVFNVLSIISISIFQRKLTTNPKILKLSTFITVFSLIFLLIDINKFTIIIYNACKSFFLVLLLNNSETKRYSIINNNKELVNKFLIEHQVMCEYALNLIRIIGYGVLFIASFINNIIIFKVLLLLISLITIKYYNSMKKI